MIKVADAVFVERNKLNLVFSDGYNGVADLSELFRQEPFRQVKDFKAFALNDGSLEWEAAVASAELLYSITQGSIGAVPPDPQSPNDIKRILQTALWEAIEENRPDIFQGALAGFVEKYGHAKVIKAAGIKSRTSAYRTLKGETSPKLDTLIRLGHAVLEISQDQRPHNL